MPALPLDEAGKYVAAAYLVFLGLLLVYVAIMAVKLSRIDRELGELADLAEERERDAADRAAGNRPVDRPAAAGPEGQAAPIRHPDGADAGAETNARGEAEGQVLKRERSTHREVFPPDA